MVPIGNEMFLFTKHLLYALSTELTRGPPELVQHLQGQFISAQERCMSLI
jgi:hypothetical protein